jgi:hypothetical protein
MRKNGSSTGFVEMIRTALAQDTPSSTVFNILMLLHRQHACANLFHVTYFFHNKKTLFQCKPFQEKYGEFRNETTIRYQITPKNWTR